MGNTLISNAGDGCAIRGDAAGTPAASHLSLAAAPTFVVMALWSAVAGGPAEMMCSSGGSAWSLNGMAAMYTLMSVFHVSPWLTLLSNWWNEMEDDHWIDRHCAEFADIGERCEPCSDGVRRLDGTTSHSGLWTQWALARRGLGTRSSGYAIDGRRTGRKACIR